MPNYNAETLAAMRESNELAHDPNVRTYSVEEAFATLTDSDLDSPRNQQRLEQIKADFDNGMRNYHSHELIEGQSAER